MRKTKFTNPVLAAVMVAFISVCSQIAIVLPSGLPLTLQTLAITVCGFLLGAKWGCIAVLVYIFSGLLGIPVFSSFGSGFHYVIGPTGGFILGFLPLCFFCAVSENFKKPILKILFVTAGILILYITGCVWYSVFTKTPLILSFTAVVLPFIPKDILCAISGFFVAFKIKRKIC